MEEGGEDDGAGIGDIRAGVPAEEPDAAADDVLEVSHPVVVAVRFCISGEERTEHGRGLGRRPCMARPRSAYRRLHAVHARCRGTDR